MTGAYTDWTPDLVAELTRLWNVERLPPREIGRRLGFSKNAVVGKASRLGLDRRPNPVDRSKIVVHERPSEPACQWIDGEASKRKFCGKPGFPWCREHRARVFVPAGVAVAEGARG